MMIKIKDIVAVANQVGDKIREIENILNSQFGDNKEWEFITVDPEFSVYSGVYSLFITVKVYKGVDFPNEIDRFEISLESLKKIQEKTNADNIWISYDSHGFLISLEFSFS